DIDVALCQSGGMGHEADVTHQRHVHSGPPGRAIDRRDHRLFHPFKRQWNAMDVAKEKILARQAVHPAELRHLREVAPGAKRPAFAGYHHHLDPLNRLSGLGSSMPSPNPGQIEGVELLRPVEGEGGYTLGVYIQANWRLRHLWT